MSDVVSLVKELVTIESTKEKKENLIKVLEYVMPLVADFTVERFESNGVPSMLVYSQKTRPERFKVIFNAHLDVVPGQASQFTPVEKDGRLYGRGTYDMKGGAAAEILAFKEMAKHVSYPIALQLVTDEEIGGLNGTKYQAGLGVRGDFVIAGEPTNYGVNNKAKGIYWIKVTFRGKAGHGAYPWQGENALWKMNRFLDTLGAAFPVPEKEAWLTTVNLAKVETGNQTFNKVPEDAVVWLDVRYVPEDSDSFVEKLTELAGSDGSVEFLMRESAQFTDENNSFVRALRESVTSITGEESPIIVKHGGSDIRHFNAVGCDGVTFGPKGYGLHTDEEYVEVQSLQDYYEVLVHFLKALS